MNLHDLLAIPRHRHPRKPALVVSGDGGDLRGGPGEGGPRAWSYAQLLAAADGLASDLAGRGLEAGDRVALHLGNRPETVVTYLALLRLGAVAVPLNLAYRAPEIAHVLADAEPRLLLTSGPDRPDLDALPAAERRRLEAVLDVADLVPPAPARDAAAAGGEAGGTWAIDTGGGGSPGAAGPFEEPLRVPVDGSALALLLYTSGTTGRSKGAMIRHDNLLATLTGLLAAWAWEPADRLLLTLPLFHTHGLVVGLLTALAAGATVLLEPRFDAAAVADRLLAGSPTVFFGVPTMYVRLVDELERRRAAGADTSLPAMRLFASGSAPLAPETFHAFRELTGHGILERYGMTETGMNLSNPYAGPRVPGTVGRPLPGVSARLVDDQGEEVAEGAEGELQVAGSNVFSGYWRDPEKTAAAFVAGPDGRRWFRTGDLARRDPDSGAYTLLGRRHDLVITGGYNVYPREVEEALEALPGVAEAAVAGLPDRDRGEVVAAWLVLEPGSGLDGPGDPEDLARRLRDALAERLAPFKLPRRAFPVESLPRNALGKVQRHRLPGRSTPP